MNLPAAATFSAYKLNQVASRRQHSNVDLMTRAEKALGVRAVAKPLDGPDQAGAKRTRKRGDERLVQCISQKQCAIKVDHQRHGEIGREVTAVTSKACHNRATHRLNPPIHKMDSRDPQKSKPLGSSRVLDAAERKRQ